MKILFLAPYPPYPPRSGGQIRMYQMLRLLAGHHDVYLLCFVHGEEKLAEQQLASLRQFCRVDTVAAPVHTSRRRLRTLLFSSMPDMVLRGHDPRFAAALRSLLAAERWDIVQAESIEMAQYGLNMAEGAGSARAGRRRRPLFCYDAWNAEYLLQSRAFTTDIRTPRRLPAGLYSLLQWQKLRRYEQRIGRRFDVLLAVSEADRRTLGRLAQALCSAVVPNGVDTEFYRREAGLAVPIPPHHRAELFILFTGTLDFRANVDALRWFVRSVWGKVHARRPELRFCVVGQRPVAAVRELAAEPGVRIVGAVDDIRPWFANAAAYVLPMRVGGGVRLKLLETLAMELPCVTTPLGAEGVEGFVPATHALVANDHASFQRALEQILDDPVGARALAISGRRLVEERYDWRRIVREMEQTWQARLEEAGG